MRPAPLFCIYFSSQEGSCIWKNRRSQWRGGGAGLMLYVQNGPGSFQGALMMRGGGFVFPGSMIQASHVPRSRTDHKGTWLDRPRGRSHTFCTLLAPRAITEGALLGSSSLGNALRSCSHALHRTWGPVDKIQRVPTAREEMPAEDIPDGHGGSAVEQIATRGGELSLTGGLQAETWPTHAALLQDITFDRTQIFQRGVAIAFCRKVPIK